MYCHNCGKQIPDNAAFCPYCGAGLAAAAPAQPQPQPQPQPQVRPQAGQAAPGQQPYTAQPQPQPQAPAQPQKPQRKWTMFLLPVAAFVVAALLGRFVLAPAMQPKADSGAQDLQPAPTMEIETPDTAPDTATDTEGSETDPAYSAVFEGARVFHMSFIFGLDVESFAMKDADGSIVVHDFGHKGDQVLAFVETWYYPGITSDQQDYIQTLTEAAEQEAAAYSGVACADVTYSYNEDNQYFTIKYAFSDLDQPENLQVLYDMGIVDGTDGLSLAACEQSALADGYAKR